MVTDEQLINLSPQVNSSPYQAPMHNLGGAIIMLTNPENDLYKLELTLRGSTENSDGEIQSVGDPLLNEEGIKRVIGQVQTIVNQITILSYLEDEEISHLLLFLADTLAKDLMLNKKRYDIKNPSARDIIFFSSISTSYVCMCRAKKGGERKFWKGSVQEIHSKVEAGGGSKKGLFDKAMNWRR